MKNMTRNLLIAGAAMCGIGVVCYGVGSLLGGKDYVKAADLKSNEWFCDAERSRGYMVIGEDPDRSCS